jgi:hypothetical protein
LKLKKKIGKKISRKPPKSALEFRRMVQKPGDSWSNQEVWQPWLLDAVFVDENETLDDTINQMR